MIFRDKHSTSSYSSGICLDGVQKMLECKEGYIQTDDPAIIRFLEQQRGTYDQIFEMAPPVDKPYVAPPRLPETTPAVEPEKPKRGKRNEATKISQSETLIKKE